MCKITAIIYNMPENHTEYKSILTHQDMFFHVIQFALIKGLPTLDKEVKRKNKAQTLHILDFF